MTDFLNPQEWTVDTSYSGDNFNRMEREEAETRLLSEYTSIAIAQAAAIETVTEKMRRYCNVFAVDLPVNTDYTIQFPQPKDNAEYGVSIVWRTHDGDGAIFGWGGQTRNNITLNVMRRTTDAVTVRYQKNWAHGTDTPGSSFCPVLVTCYGGINF